MHVSRFAVGLTALVAITAAAVLPTGQDARADAGATGAGSAAAEYVVLYTATDQRAGDEQDADPVDAATIRAARAAITAAGGSMVSENTTLGTAVVRATAGDFARVVDASAAVAGAALHRPVGHLPGAPVKELTERLSPADLAAAAERVRGGQLRAPAAGAAARPVAPAPATVGIMAEPLASAQWDMQMIGATTEGSYSQELGDRRVRVGIMDTGVDGNHPDIAPNFDGQLSRNFAIDLPEVDGPCEVETCLDPADVDENGHGTHIASTIGSPINGLGVAGVAPNVTLVNVRAGQDSGFFFLQPVLDALTYSADIGLDVINMSFYVDPWQYNCANNPADSTTAQAEQRMVVAAMQRAIDYATARGVTPIGALGNEATDLGMPTTDSSSPNFPEGQAYDRTVDNTCLDVPAETKGVISVAAMGPSGRKAYYSNYGIEQTDFAAPGGDAFDTFDQQVDPAAQILAAYPEALGRSNGDIDEAGEPTSPFVIRDCNSENVCGYYQYLQGTSMAAPHAAGVAALAVSRFGLGGDGGASLEPALTELALTLSAERRPCPQPADFTYTINGADGNRSFVHTCEATVANNGFYGRGMVSASGVAALPGLLSPTG